MAATFIVHLGQLNGWSNKQTMITKSDLVWRNIFLLTILHLLALASFFSFVYIRWSTLFIVYAPTLLASLVGITAGKFIRIKQKNNYPLFFKQTIRCSSIMVSSIIQGSSLFTNIFDDMQYDCLTERHLCLVPRSSCTSQILWNRCRSTQFETWIFLCPYGMVNGTKESWGLSQRFVIIFNRIIIN